MLTMPPVNTSKISVGMLLECLLHLGAAQVLLLASEYTK